MPKAKPQKLPELLYFSPEPDREGHASFTHVHEIIDNLRIMGWSIDYYSPTYTSSKLPGPLQRLVRIGGALFRAIFRHRPGIIYMRWHFAAFPLSVWAKINKIPVVIEVNGPVTDLFIAWPIARKFSGFFNWLMKSQLEWSAAIVPVTEGLAKLSQELLSREIPIKVIPNGANTLHFHPKAAERPIAIDNLPSTFAVFFGTMAPWQGIDDLLSAVSSSSWPESCPLLIAGDGDRRSATQAVAKLHPENLRYLGRLPYQELPKLVSRSCVSFVCTQNIDGRASSGMAPLKLFESMACGVPVIATHMPFQEDIVREANAGILVDENSPDQLIEALREILTHREEGIEMGERGRKFIDLNHSWRARAEETNELLVQVATGENEDD